MKQITIFLALVTLISCNQNKKKADSILSQSNVSNALKADDSLKAIISANIHKQPVIDTVFLGFTFNMTKKQALAHYAQLIKTRKLVMIDDNGEKRYVYPMAFEMAKANAVIAPEFYNDKLYKLSLVIMPAEDIVTPQTVYLQAAVAYMKKYNNNNYKLFQEPGLIDPSLKKIHWIKNNLHINLYQNVEGAIVSYTNMPVEEMVDKEKSTAADSSKKQTKSDI